jgi:hypothetical protein
MSVVTHKATVIATHWAQSARSQIESEKPFRGFSLKYDLLIAELIFAALS